MAQSGAVEGSLAVIGIGVVAHTGMLGAVKSFVQGKSTGGAISNPSKLNASQFGVWAAAYTGLAVILLMGGESEEYGRFFQALAVLIAGGVLLAYYKDVIDQFGGKSK